MIDTSRMLAAVAAKTYTPGDVIALCVEVDALRQAIRDHRRRHCIDPQPWDVDLWRWVNAREA